MKKVYLFCSAGMSTSILASKMQEVANSQHLNIPISVIDQDDYGMMNGERVLKKAILLIKKNNK